MTIAIAGAAAGIGREAVNQALDKGHTVIALSTNVSGIARRPGLTIIQGSAANISDLKKVMVRSDALLITVGTKKKKNTTLFSEIARALVAAADEVQYTKPVLIITGFGAGESASYLGFFMKMVIRLFLRDQYLDKTVMEQIITASHLQWGIVRPGMLTNAPLSGHYGIFTALEPQMKVGKISRADVAEYLLKEAVLQENLGKKVTLT
ncbi:NAD(P)-dependent oxidoreductase [Dawidia soli]|uniref:NAD(P)H-binding protein n=1 Tax=Dawidia soli TaxID=2782352 RepID=A0AAP2D5R3_9BACT|nr:NAD(P)-binding oxidoreductase [Dawidia soli]MBT1684970.1 NAD(P)H-binding protein [Dawidia soli]